MPESQVLFVERVTSPIGDILVTHDGRALCNVEFADSNRRDKELAQHFPRAAIEERKRASDFAKALRAYFKGDIAAIDDLPVASFGTDFQRKVWQALRKIPAGETRGYGDFAKSVRRPNAARAIGHANGANPIAVIVPCHRLIGANGSLVKYGGGLERKRWLIDHEAKHARR